MFDGNTARPRGRPSAYSDKIASEICARLSAGESLASICRDPAMPCEKSVYNWLERHADFVQSYAHARAQQAEHWADELIELSDSVLSRDGRPADHAEVQAMRLAIDTRKWLLSKLLPKKYGDRLDVQQDGQLVVRVITGLADEPAKPAAAAPIVKYDDNVKRLPQAKK